MFKFAIYASDGNGGMEQNHATSFLLQAQNAGPLGRWAVGPLGRWAVGPLGRWAVGPLGRWAVGPLAVTCLALSCLASSVHAQQQSSTGEWRPSYKWSQGTASGEFGGRTWTNYGPLLSETFAWNYATSGYDDSPFDYRDTQSSNFDMYNSGFAGLFGVGTPQSNSNSGSASATAVGIAGHAQVDGQIQVTWNWVPRAGYNNAGPVPPKLKFVVRANATATANSRVDSNLVIMATRDLSKESGEASVGLGSGNGVKNPVTSSGSQWTARCAKFYSLDTNGSNQISVDPITLHAKGSVAGGRSVALPPISIWGHPKTPYKDDVGQVSANVSVSAELKDRWVSLSSSTLEPSYYKGAVPAIPMLHNPNIDGEKNADSVVHLYDGLWQTRGSQFNANLAGQWNSPTYDWSSEGDSGPATGFRSLQEEQQSSLTTGFNLGSGESSFPKSSTVKVTATDTDGTVADNSFNINWHLQYEKSRDLPDGPDYKEISWIEPTHIPPQGGLGIKTVPARTLTAEAAINSVLLLAELGGAPGASELGKIFEFVTGLSEWQMTEPSYKVDTSDYKNDGAMFKQVLLDNPENISNMTVAKRNVLKEKTPDELQLELGKYACFIGRVRIHKTKSYLADKYDSHGYVGWDNVFSYDYTYPNGKEFQLFYQFGNQSSPPSEGDSEIPPSYNVS